LYRDLFSTNIASTSFGGTGASPVRSFHSSGCSGVTDSSHQACEYLWMKRKYAYRRKLPHFQWTDKTYFITSSASNKETLTPGSRDLVLQTCINGDGDKYDLHAAVVMPDHVHLLLTPLEDEEGPVSIPEIMQEIKSVSAHRINKYLLRKGRIWQEESFDRAMREVEDVRGRIEYIVGNSVRAGLVSNPYDYRWLWREP
jgi:REP element-mobilizing transposase RayT